MAPPTKHPTARILDAARTLALTEGPRAVSVAAIADASGAPAGTLYHRFGSRDGILRAAWLRALEGFQARWLDAALDPDPLEPYYLSQGFRVGELVFVSGQAALDERGAIVGAGDFDAQAEQTFRNLARVLAAGGSSLDRVVKVTIFLTDMSNFPKIVELRKRWFTAPYPADTIVEVRSLALPELQIEIEAIAVAG